jgi:phage head maturation protease
MQFDAMAFDDFLSCSTDEVYAAMDHNDQHREFASWRRGSLLLDSDSYGVFFIALPRQSADGRIAVGLIGGRHLCSMSIKAAWNASWVRESGGIDILRRATIVEVSAVQKPGFKGTTVQVAESSRAVPRTVEQLVLEDCRLRDLNLMHKQSGTLAEWKQEKSLRRAELLESLRAETAMAVA